MATSDHKAVQIALAQAIDAERAKLISAHAVQKCLYEVLLYADGEHAVLHAEAAHVVAALMEDVLTNLDAVQLHRVIEGAQK